ncbi:AraC family transcriptional regulator [Escherichia coli]|uniref:AraC family transcriptional regulator n=1 Tax=Escherichia coli TaxID=562 RepID=A0A484Y8R8_ECOLX|nr:AraC family transcriptional regulator [Escherichia coli]
MYHDVSYLLSRLINGPLSLRQIYFASSNGPVPDLAYQVDFPRLEIVLEGEFIDTGAGAALVPGDVAVRPCWWLEFSTMASPRHHL